MIKIKYIAAGVLAAILPMLFVLQPEAAEKQETKVVRVGYFSFPSFNDVDENGRKSGYGYEYLQELAKYNGWEYQYVEASWEECQKLLEEGRIDLLGSAQKTPDRMERFAYAQTESGTSYAVLCTSRKNKELAYEDFDSFEGMTVGIMEGNSRNEIFNQYCTDNHFTVMQKTYPNEKSLTAALYDGSVDAILTSNLRKVDNERIIAKFAPSAFYFITTKGNQTLLDELNYAQAQIKLANPFFDMELYDKYYSEDFNDILVFSKAEQKYLDSIKTLKAVYLKNFAPVEYQDEKSGEFKGITADFMKMMQEKTGLNIEYIGVDNMQEAVTMVNNGSADIICGFEKDYAWTETYNVNLTGAYLSIYNMFVTNPSGGKEGIALCDYLLPELQYKYASAGRKYVLYPTVESCLDAVANKEAAGTYVNAYTMNWYRNMHKYNELRTTAVMNALNTRSIAVAKTANPYLLSVLNKTVSHLSNADMDKLVNSNMAASQRMTVSDFFYQNPLQFYIVSFVILGIIMACLVVVLYQRTSNNKKIYKVLYLDNLTGLWNYNKFTIEITKLLQETRTSPYVLVYFDINHFKFINDAYGYTVGDEILKNIANKLKSSIGEGEYCARISDDNFVTLLKYAGYDEFTKRMRAFDDEIKLMHKEKGENYKITVTSGIYLIQPQDNPEFAYVIDCANMARKTLKTGHKSNMAFYDEEINKLAIAQQEIEACMESALEQGQFVPYFQPQYDLQTGEMTGMEALVRWKHAIRGMIMPGDFIPLFERNGFIVEIDFNIYEQVCKVISGWIDSNRPHVHISCNFSRLHMSKPDFVDRLCSIADQYHVPHELLEIEITESAVQEDQGRLVELLKNIKIHKFSIAMDDFGSGYSSLNILKLLPVDILKLDKDFLQKSFVGHKDRIIIEGFVNIADKLELTVICEGVETEEQAEFLRSIKCEQAQGYLYSRPVPLEEAEERLQQSEAGKRFA